LLTKEREARGLLLMLMLWVLEERWRNAFVRARRGRREGGRKRGAFECVCARVMRRALSTVLGDERHVMVRMWCVRVCVLARARVAREEEAGAALLDAPAASEAARATVEARD
jgi:hypothetical protein